ncbi:sarcosine oxidase subunit gamma [Amphritea japonica]|uniref:Sarcosine oxidase, subunit gamma n=1 Tax=Amphritea japonica ATCC BAA-1530 TaxID=1278309 RepID=A0A7R6PEY7_9GAMM|nr:sarcosine oxidase subunit gamma family protein [Amphritea japonica]BBB26996.1 sarcosine oxidase, subunit gamma [Amphritea japonica ATCC BAA-1530]
MSDLNVMTPAEIAATKAAVMDQVPGPEIQGQSPLHHADLETLAKQGPKAGGVHLREHKLLGHLTLRCNPDNADQLAAVERVLGVGLPLQPLTSVEKGDYSIRWMSPDEWLILVPGLEAFEVESKFRDEMGGHYSLVNSSGGSTVLELSGDNVVELLKKCIPVDLHAAQFPVGKVVSTVFSKSTAIVRRTGEKRFELIIRRSFADYIWLWLQDASREFGLVIEA